MVPGLGLKVKLLFFLLSKIRAAAAALHSSNTLNKRRAFSHAGVQSVSWDSFYLSPDESGSCVRWEVADDLPVDVCAVQVFSVS